VAEAPQLLRSGSPRNSYGDCFSEAESGTPYANRLPDSELRIGVPGSTPLRAWGLGDRVEQGAVAAGPRAGVELEARRPPSSSPPAWPGPPCTSCGRRSPGPSSGRRPSRSQVDAPVVGRHGDHEGAQEAPVVAFTPSRPGAPPRCTRAARECAAAWAESPGPRRGWRPTNTSRGGSRRQHGVPARSKVGATK